ncbi:hypothetical protein DT075_37040 [Bacillus licheniformis]|nr:hypothetical protein DT075_37040 [Bacillus licheniformis]
MSRAEKSTAEQSGHIQHGVSSESFMRLIKVVPRDPRPFVTGVFCIFKEVVAMEEGWPEWPHNTKRKRRCDRKW